MTRIGRLAAVAILLVVALVVTIWRRGRDNSALVTAAIGPLVVILVQAGLGAVWLVYRVVRMRRPRIETAAVHACLALYLLNVRLGAAHGFTQVRVVGLIVAHTLVAGLAWIALVGAPATARTATATAPSAGTAGGDAR